MIIYNKCLISDKSAACNSGDLKDDKAAVPPGNTLSTMYSSTTQDESPDLSPVTSLPVRQQRETFLI